MIYIIIIATLLAATSATSSHEFEEAAVTLRSIDHHHRELRTIFCRCVADFETFYDRRRRLKSYFQYSGDAPITPKDSRASLRSKYYDQDYGRTPLQSNDNDAVLGPDGYFIVDGITVLPLDDTACIVSQTNTALRTFVTLLFKPRNTERSRSRTSFSSLFSNRNRRALSSIDGEQHEVVDRDLQGWGERRKNKPTGISRGSSGRKSIREKMVNSVLSSDLRENGPEDKGESTPTNSKPSPSGYPQVFPCPPSGTLPPSAAPSELIVTDEPTVSPSFPETDQPVDVTDEPTISLQPTSSPPSTDETEEPTIVSPEPTISPVPSVVPSLQIVATEMPSNAPSIVPSIFDAPSVSPSGSRRPTISPVPTNVKTLEPTVSNAPSISLMPSADPTTSLSPSTVTENPSISTAPSVLPSVLPSTDPTTSVSPTISPRPTISPAPNGGVTSAPITIAPTVSQAPSVSAMPSTFSDRPSAVPSFLPTVSPTILSLPTTSPVANITALMPRNNLCVDAMTLPSDGAPMTGTTVYGTNEASYGCNMTGGIQTSISPGVWFTTMGNGNIYEISTCSPRTNFGTAIQVLTGDCGNLQCLRNAGRLFDRECIKNDSNEWNRLGTRVRIETIPNEMYSLLVLSRLGENTGNFEIHLEEVKTPTNDRCDNAIQIDVDVPRLHIGNTENATVGTNYGCGSQSLGVNNAAPGIWYVTEGNGETYTATTCAQWTDYNTSIQVFTGSSCDELQCVDGTSSDGCVITSGSSTVTFPTVPGELYYIFVFGRQPTDIGTFILTVTTYDPTAV